VRRIHVNRLGVWAAVILSATGLAAADVRISSYGYNSSMTVNAPNLFGVTVENLGPDPATAISLKATLPTGAELVPSAGCSQAASVVTCTLPNLATGRSTTQTVRFIPRNVAKVRVEFEVQSSDDNNPANNSAGYDANIFPQNILEVGAGSANPASRNVGKGQSNLPVLQFTLTNKTEFPAIFDGDTKPSIYVNRIFLKASGTGHDAKDINAVRLYADTNNNGVVDAGDPLLEVLVFGSDDGILELPGLSLGVGSPEERQGTFLVAYDLNDQVHLGSLSALAAGLGAGALGLGLIAGGQISRRRRFAWLAVGLLVLVFSACTSPSTVQPEPTSLTYGLKITLLTTSGGPNDVLQVSLPINGATLTVQR
jgi:uncharacterized repeat protein (TIGR01451 family)